MNAVERALTQGIDQISKAEVFYLVYKIDKIALPLGAQEDFWIKVGEELKIKNSLLDFRNAFKMYYLGYTQCARDKIGNE